MSAQEWLTVLRGLEIICIPVKENSDWRRQAERTSSSDWFNAVFEKMDVFGGVAR